jgi:hypothetical protein
MIGPRHAAFLIIVMLAVLGCAAASPGAAPAGRDSVGSDEKPYEPGATAAPGANHSGDQALVVYTGSIDLDVANVDDALAAARHLVTGLGGYVSASRVSDSGSSMSAYVTYRVPSARWDEAVAGLEALGERVVNEEIGTEDVTSQVVDLDARIANLRATEAALQAIMERATTITDVLKVQQELTAVRGDIESMTAQRDYLAGRAAFGTLDVAYNVPVTAQAVAAGGWDLGREIDAALAALVRIGQWLASVLVWVAIVALPVLVPLALLIWLVAVLRRRWLASHQRPQTPNV